MLGIALGVLDDCTREWPLCTGTIMIRADGRCLMSTTASGQCTRTMHVLSRHEIYAIGRDSLSSFEDVLERCEVRSDAESELGL